VKRVAIVLLMALMGFCADIEPSIRARITGAVLDMVSDGKRVYVATDASAVVVLDEENLSTLWTIPVRQIKDFMGELNNADIYSVDYLDGKILYLAQAEEGYAELFVYENNSSKKVLDKSRMYYAKAAKFVDGRTAILALMSDEVVLYDIEAQKEIGREKAGEYFYSVMAIDPARKRVAIGDEGGEIAVIDTKTLKKLYLFKEVNKDKILSVDINEKYVAAGSRADKTFALYDLATGRAKTRRNPDFFIYVVGLSKDGRHAVYGDNEHYILNVVDTANLERRHRLVGHENIVNVIRFTDAKTILTGSETGEIFKWRLP